MNKVHIVVTTKKCLENDASVILDIVSVHEESELEHAEWAKDGLKLMIKEGSKQNEHGGSLQDEGLNPNADDAIVITRELGD